LRNARPDAGEYGSRVAYFLREQVYTLCGDDNGRSMSKHCNRNHETPNFKERLTFNVQRLARLVHTYTIKNCARFCLSLPNEVPSIQHQSHLHIQSSIVHGPRERNASGTFRACFGRKKKESGNKGRSVDECIGMPATLVHDGIYMNRSSRAWVHCAPVRDRRRRVGKEGKGPGTGREERKRRGVRSSQRCMRKKAKLRKHLANGDYHTLGLAARRSPLSVPSERDRRRRCRCSCIAASARIIAKVTTRLSFSATVLLLDNGAGALRRARSTKIIIIRGGHAVTQN
jgi:hypothetical protein